MKIRIKLTPRLRRWLWRSSLAIFITGGLMGVALVVLFFALPFPIERLEGRPRSPMVTDRTGRVLLTLVGTDDQWRYPIAAAEMSPWITQATIAVEDADFKHHCGIDLGAVARAAWQNISEGEIVSGASTITMQLCRMMDDRPRTFTSKAVESFRALQLERIRSKGQILETYLNIAPYGGNIRGVEAASRAYFGKRASDLSLGEAALLAGLPKSPSRYRPDRYPENARTRRDHVLTRMAELDMITELQRKRAADEPIVITRAGHRTLAPHAAWMAMERNPLGGRTTIDADIQAEVERLVCAHARTLPPRTQIAVTVIDIESADVLAVVGSADFDHPIDGQVNGALARRSPGSALKPFIYAAAFEAKRLNEKSTVYDMPIHRAGWSPENFDRTYAGEITAAEALRRSLNVPAILVEEGMGVQRCAGLIRDVGIDLPANAQSRTGLGLAVGGAEVTLFDLTNAYATLGRGGIRRTPRLLLTEQSTSTRVLSANVCSAIDDILSTVNRRPNSMSDLANQDIPWFMWKTGTSSRRRDAWAVGHNRIVAVGVWVGRFPGAGNTHYTGAEAAEPLLAALFAAPRLRNEIAPAPHDTWAVSHPLQVPVEAQPTLQITEPSNGAVFVATAGHAIIHAQANRDEALTWFIDGKCAGEHSRGRFVMPSGDHEIRCVGETGDASAIRIIVRPA